MDNKQPYDVRASILVRHIVEQSKRDGQLQRLKQAYEQMQFDQLSLEYNKRLNAKKAYLCKMDSDCGGSFCGSGFGFGVYGGDCDNGRSCITLKQLTAEENCALAKLQRIEDVKRRLRAALGLHLKGPNPSDKFVDKF